LTLADFNHDGRADMVVISGSQSVSVSLSRGDGTFQQATTLQAGKGPYLLANLYAIDVNGDGHLDITGYGYSLKYQQSCSMNWGCSSSGTLYTNRWLGKGDGTFGKVTTASTRNYSYPGPWPKAPFNWTDLYSDFNRDGIDDYAALRPLPGPEIVIVVLLNADGTEQPAQEFAAGPNLSSIAAGDVNGDGWIDLVVVNSLSSGSPTVSVLFNDGNW
jgi:hypothetical protein